MKLREYQSPQVNKLIRQLQNGNEAALISAVGTGKTIVTAVVGDELIKRGIVKKVIVAAPFNTIVKEFPALRGKKILGGTPNNSQYLIGNIQQSPNVNTVIAVITGNSSEFISTSHHAMANHRVRTAVNQADDLSDLLLVIDEAHHCFASDDEENKDGTLLGEIAEKIKQKGGKLLYVTATPYRTVGNQTNLIFDPLKCNPVIRTIGEQMRDGYAPSLNTEYIHVRSKLINAGVAGIFGDLLTTRISDPQLKTLLPRIVKQWKAEKYPKTILLVPAGNADHTAMEVKKYLEEITFPTNVAKIRGRKNPSVLISVGDSGSSFEVNGKEMTEIEYDKANGGHIYDIVIGCRKFDEGTDVSSASHIFMVGLPSSVRLFHQRTGRVLRDKKNIEGYAEWFGTEWLNTSKVVFFAPIGKKTKEFDYKVGRQLLHCIFAAESYQEYCESLNASQNIRIAFEDKHKKAKTEATRAELEAVMALLGNIELNELKDYSSNEYNELVKESLNPDMTVGERIDMIKSSPLSDAQRVIELNNIINHLPEDIKEKIDWDAIVNSIVKSAKPKKDVGFDVPPTSAISDVFDEVLREFHSVKITTNTERAVQQVFSSLSGETFKEWAEKCSQFMGENNAITKCNDIIEFRLKHGTFPKKEDTDSDEAKLGSYYTSMRSAKSNGGISPSGCVWYPVCDSIADKAGLSGMFDIVDPFDIQLNLLLQFIDTNKRFPTQSDDASLSRWLSRVSKETRFIDAITDAGHYGLLDARNPIQRGIQYINDIVSYVNETGSRPSGSHKLAQKIGAWRKTLVGGDNGHTIYQEVVDYATKCGVGDIFIIDESSEISMAQMVVSVMDFIDSNKRSPDANARKSTDAVEYDVYKNYTKILAAIRNGTIDNSIIELLSSRGYSDMIDLANGKIRRLGKENSYNINTKPVTEDEKNNLRILSDFYKSNSRLPTATECDELGVKSWLWTCREKSKNNKLPLNLINSLSTYGLPANTFNNVDFEQEALNKCNQCIDHCIAYNAYPSSTTKLGHFLSDMRRAKKNAGGTRIFYTSLQNLADSRGYGNMFNANWKDDLQ